MSEESPRSPQSRGRMRGHIAAILASAREEVNGNALAPSLEFPSRPKTPASYDPPAPVNSNLGIFNMKSTVRSSAGNRNRTGYDYSSVTNKREQRNAKSRSAPADESTTEPIAQVTKRSAITVAPLSRIVESGFNPEQLLNDLSFVLDSDTFEFNSSLNDRVEAFIKFLQPLQPDADLSAGLISAIEEIIFKLSGIALTMLQNPDSDPLQVLSVLRLNLRILVRLFETSTSVTENTNSGLFDLLQVSMVINQCTQALYQLCVTYYLPDSSGTSTLQLVSLLASNITDMPPTSVSSEDIYEVFDECDIEIEDGNGAYVPLRPTTASSSTNSNTLASISSAAVPHTNGDIAGVSYLNQLMTQLFPTVREIFAFLLSNKNKSLDTTDQLSVLVALLESANHISGVYKLLSVNEIDCKWLNSAGILPPLLGTLTLFQSTKVYSCVTSAVYNITTTLADAAVNCVITMLAVVRNCSEVKSCRQVLLEREITPVLCLLLGVFSSHPKVVVNCTRVLAKLSMFETCREQINYKDQYLQNLVDVVLREARGGTGGKNSGTNDIISGTSDINGGKTDINTHKRDTNTGSNTSGSSGKNNKGSDEVEMEVEWPGQHTWTILTRVCFALGNLTTTNERNRKLIGTFGLTGVADKEKDDPLVDLLASCGLALSSMFESDAASDDNNSEQNASADDDENEDEGEEEGGDNDSRSAERELVDATVKLVRLLANLSMDPEIGRVLGSKNHNALEMLVKMLVCVREGTTSSQEELLLNVIAACTNLTYYSCKYINEGLSGRASPTTPTATTTTTATTATSVRTSTTKTTVADRLLDLSSQLSFHLVTCLTTHPNTEIQLESARVLGNLTRIESIRRTLLHTYGPELLVDLLKHPQWDVVSAVTGIMVNLSADPECKQILLQQEGSKSVLMALSWELRKVGLQDPDLSTLMCQALYNLLLTTPSSPHTAPTHIQDRLHSTLDKLINQGMDETESTGTTEFTQFLKVGITLMKLIAKQRE